MYRRLIIVAVLLFAVAGGLLAQPAYRHHLLVKVMPGSKDRLRQLSGFTQLDLVPGDVSDEPNLLAYPEDLTLLTQQGFPYQVIHEDEEQFYAQRLANPNMTMGGYHTYTEIVAALDSIHAAHPTITTAKFSIGNTLEGRTMWVMKISDNPDVDENEPEVFYNSLIHAREPEGMECVLYFMHYLTDRYGTDPDVTSLVDNREFYFLPCVNPDGYVYNQTTNPGGGGMFRKNRNGQGIDLNRNFDAAWGIDNVGSSPTPSDETYRGASAFSELETQHIRDFVNSRHFATEIDYHTYGNWVLYPWGTSYYPPPNGNGLCEDNAIFQWMADSIVYYNSLPLGSIYTPGTPWQTLYNTNGGSFDWEYGITTNHNRIFAMTTEIGGNTDGFWPVQSRILPLAQENLQSNLFMARIAGMLAPMPYKVNWSSQCEDEWNGNGNSLIEPGEGISLTVALKNFGTQSLSALQGTISTSDPNFTVITDQANWPALSVDQIGSNSTPFQLTIAPTCPAPTLFDFSLHLTNADGLDTTLALTATVGVTEIVDNVESGVQGWTTGGTLNLWHISTRRSNSATHSWFCGHETGTYSSQMNCYLLSDTLVLSAGAEIAFDQWYNLETNYDYGYIEINAGSGWIQVGNHLTGSSGDWVHTVLSLPVSCLGTKARIRFHMTSDGATENEGWYIDNIHIQQAAPPASIQVSPTSITCAADSGAVVTRNVLVHNAGVSDLTYQTGFDLSATSDSTGPDSYGYCWKLSSMACGPTYQWLPITTSGTPITFAANEGDAVKGPYTLGFMVPFYGSNYGRLWVSGNGWVSFADSTTSTFINTTFPNATAPAASICAWWDDLKPQLTGSNVRFWTNSVDSAAVLYGNIHAGTAPNQGTYNFEILVTKYGEIKIFYGDMGTIRLNSASIGIQNAAKSIGLTYLCNRLGITNNSAIRFGMGPRYAAVLPTFGTVAGGNTDTLHVYFFGSYLCGDPSLTDLDIRSNDLDTPIVPVALTVVSVIQPGTPAGLSIRTNGNDLILRWQPAENATSYIIQRAQSSEGEYLPIGTSTGETFTDVNALDLPGPLFYQVIAVNGDFSRR